MKNKKLILLFILVLTFLGFSEKALAATNADHTDFNNAQHTATMQVSGDTEISFIKKNGSTINWDNPLTRTDGDTFGMKASFQLSNINDIITRVSNGEISTIPTSQLSFIQMLKRSAVISGSFDLKIDLNEGLGDYFSVNQTVLDNIIANPNELFANNSAYASVFNITSVSEENNIISISVSVKSGVTGGNILDLADSFETLDFTVDNLFTLNSSLWDSVDQINRGEFRQLVKIYAPQDETIFIVKIPSNLVFLASLVGAKNPYVGVKLEMSPGYGALNLGFVLVYEGNGNTSGTAPIDVLNPYNDETTAILKDAGDLAKENSRFIGWSTDQNYVAGVSKLYQPGDSYLMNKNLILYAQWEDAHKLIYDLNDSEESPADRNGGVAYEMLEIDSLIHEAPHYSYQPTRNGYTFKGWFFDKSGTLPVKNDSILGKDTTIYAIWEKNAPIIDPKKPIDPITQVLKVLPITGSSEQRNLPQTGEKNLAIYGSLIAVMSGLGLCIYFKKRENRIANK